MSNKYFFGGIIAFFAGVFVHSLFIDTWFIPIWVLLVALFVFLLLAIPIRKTKYLVIPVLVCMFLLGLVRFNLSQTSGDPELDLLVEQKVESRGIIVSDPDRRESTTRFLLDAGYTSKIEVSTHGHPRLLYGDEVIVSGILRKPENFVGDTGWEFNYVGFLGKDDIYHQVSFAELEKLSEGNGSFIKRNLLGLKNTFLGSINKNIKQPQSALLAGILFGEKSSLGDELEEDFRKTGLIHIVVLSGYNVTIVAYFMIWLLGLFMKPRRALVAGVFGIIGFMVLVGGGATVVRASVMALLVILAQSTGRSYHILRALFLAGLVMVLVNPKILLFDISFQLSFVATLGLIWFAPRLERFFGWVPSRIALRETFLATISTQIIVLPLILYYIGQFSLVSVPVNLLVIPIIPLAMLFGFLSSLIGLVSSVIALPFSFVTQVLHSYILKIVEWFGTLPFAAIEFPPFSWWVLVLLYVPVVYFAWKLASTTDQLTLVK